MIKSPVNLIILTLTHHKVNKETSHKLKKDMATVTKGQKHKEFQKYFVTKNRNIKNSKNTIRKKKK